jgi:hypothetical protein
MVELQNILDKSNGIFLLILALSANFVAETMGCRIQYLLTNNRWLKYLIVYLTIYFSIHITNKENENPFVLLGASAVVWVVFVLFTRMTPLPTLFVFLTLLLIYIINNYINYRNDHQKLKKQTKDKLENTQMVLLVFVVVVMIIGNTSYLIKKMREYGKSFSLISFIFGVQKCRSLINN